MSNRLIWNSDLLRVGRPGADVLTAGYDDLLFTSERGGLKVIVEGIINVPAGDGTNRFGEVAVPYGKAFSGRPWWFFNAGFTTSEWRTLGIMSYTTPGNEATGFGISYGRSFSTPFDAPDQLIMTWTSRAQTAGGVCRYRVVDIDT
jgi:hypothetical protein